MLDQPPSDQIFSCSSYGCPFPPTALDARAGRRRLGGTLIRRGPATGKSTYKPCLLNVRRPVSTDFQTQHTRREPSLASERIRAPHYDFVPATRLRDRNETTDHLRILAGRRQPTAAIGKRPGTVGKVVFATDLHESTPYMVRNSLVIFRG